MTNDEPNIIPVTLHGDFADLEVLADAVASDGLSIMLLSCAGPQMTINALSAGLRNEGSMRFKPALTRLYYSSWNQVLGARSQGYEIYKTPIGYDLWHLVAIARNTAMLIEDTEEALWAQLSGPRFTTPLLREWVPQITPKLREDMNLRKLRSFGCDAAELWIKHEALDEIVSTGIREGRMKIA